MSHNTGNGIKAGFAGITGEFNVAKAMEGEPRLPGFFGATFENVLISAFGTAEVRGIDGAIGIEHLDKLKGDRSASGAFDLQSGPADHVLPEVENEVARLGLGNRARLQLHHLTHRSVGGRDKVDGHLLGLGRLPFRVVEAGGGPAGELLAGVVGLAHEHVGLKERAVGSFPGAVGGDGLPGAVVELKLELRESESLRTVAMRTAKANIPAIPTVAQDDAQGILTPAQQASNVIAVVLHAFVVVSPARVENILADALAVQVELVKTESTGIETSAFNGFVESDTFAQMRHLTEGQRGAEGVSPRTIAELRDFLGRFPCRIIKGGFRPIIAGSVGDFPGLIRRHSAHVAGAAIKFEASQKAGGIAVVHGFDRDDVSAGAQVGL